MGRLAFAVLLLSLEVVSRAYPASSADAGVEGKASLVSGAVPPSQSGSGVANASTCLNGNSTWGSCGGGSPAGITYATTAQNWTQTISSTLTGGTQAKVTLTPCPSGVDYASGFGYDVYISDGSNSEAVAVTSGSTGSGSCSITFTPFFSHSSYTIESASSGIQETLNVACGADPTHYKNSQCNVTIPANGPGYPTHLYNTYNVYGTIFFHSNQSVLSGYGVSLNCIERGACLQVGDLISSNDFVGNAVQGLSFRNPANFGNFYINSAYAGVSVTNTAKTSQYVTITTGSAHNFRPGDMVTILFTDNSGYWGDAVVTDCGSGTSPATCTSSSTTFRYHHTGVDVASQATPGVVALAYTAILDNGLSTHFIDITKDAYGEAASGFNNFFDFWDDENAAIDHFDNNSSSLNNSGTWMGSFIFSAGNQGSLNQIAPIITLRDSAITANGASGVTVYNSNGLFIENTVIQAQGPWQIYSSNSTGNYLGAYIKNIYSETAIYLNPITPVHSPFPGLGTAGLIAGAATGAAHFQIVGTASPLGEFPSGGTGSTAYSYFIVANDTTAGTQTSPMHILDWSSTGSDSIPINWPRVANGADAITYDVIRIGNPLIYATPYPYTGGCGGGAGGSCGYVAQGLSQATACSRTLVCTYTDSGAGSTSPYATNPTLHPLIGNYAGNLNFWPGSLVSVNSSINTEVETGNLVGIGLSGNPIQIAKQCSDYGQTSPGGYTSCVASVTHSAPNQTATLLSDGVATAGGGTATKGRLNFTSTPTGALVAHHIITLVDSQPALTQATIAYRPPPSANDVWIGTDGGATLSTEQLAFGSPVAITNYIRATGDGVDTNWLERLTSKQKTFAVPVRISEGNSFTLGDGSPLSQMTIYSANNIPASHVPPQSCVDVVGKANGLTKSDQIASITPPGRLGNLSLNAYPADEGAIILHFCNPSKSEAITPLGAYSFLAVR